MMITTCCTFCASVPGPPSAAPPLYFYFMSLHKVMNMVKKKLGRCRDPPPLCRVATALQTPEPTNERKGEKNREWTDCSGQMCCRLLLARPASVLVCRPAWWKGRHLMSLNGLSHIWACTM